MTNDSTPRRHHYLPQFYLRGFSNRGFGDKKGQVWTIDLIEKKCFKTNPKNVATIQDYYTVNNAAGKPDFLVEEKLLLDIDSQGAKVIGEIERTHKIPTDEGWEALCIFIAALEVRTPRFRQQNHEVFQHFIDIFCQGRFKESEAFDDDKAAFEKGTGLSVLGLFEDVKHAIENGGFPVEVPRTQNVVSMVNLIPLIASVARQMTPYLMVATEKGRFITTDAPIHKYDRDDDRRKSGLMGVGWQSPEVEISVPLTQNCCLVLVWGDQGSPQELPAKDLAVANCNLLRLAMCSQYAFANSGDFPFLFCDEVCWGETEAIKRFADRKNGYAIAIQGGGVTRRPPKRIRR